MEKPVLNTISEYVYEDFQSNVCNFVLIFILFDRQHFYELERITLCSVQKYCTEKY